ncbi:MAG: TetR/AcrR family transcriptional regulator [Lysobacterales bacterium]
MQSRSEKFTLQQANAVRAAAAEFALYGYHGASTAGIAERLGIQQGSLYYYLKSKEEALEKVCLLALQGYLQRMELIAASQQPFAAKLQATIAAHLLRYREKDEALKVYNDERLYLPEARRSALKKLGTQYRELLETIVIEGIEAGEVRKVDPHFAAQTIIGIGNSMGDLIVRDEQLDTVAMAQKCCDLLLNGFSIKEK